MYLYMGPHGRQNAPPSSTRGKLSVPKSPIPEAEDGEGGGGALKEGEGSAVWEKEAVTEPL